jgi:ubiquinone/menaquinone biosynthesis C-methylase UbiE
MNTYYDRFWSKAAKTGKLKDFQLKWHKLNSYIPKDAAAVIVDVGCGNGEIIKEMHFINPKARYIGLDVSNIALAKASTSLPGVEFIKIIDGHSFPLPDASVDFIFASEVIEHVYDTEMAFLEMARIVRPGGCLLITTPYHGFLKNLLIVSFTFDRHFDPTGPHVRFFSRRSLLTCLRKVGLEPLVYGYFGRFWPIPHCIFVLAKRRC